MADTIHPERTQKSKHSYLFTDKHHGKGGHEDAQWADDVTREEEFSVFDEADLNDICDADGRLYGVLQDADGELRCLGTWKQEVAEFPQASAGSPWHGYPIWAVNQSAPANRRHPRMRPAKEVFDKMELAEMINAQHRKRLYRGNHP
jgi:hypothetical protein